MYTPSNDTIEMMNAKNDLKFHSVEYKSASDCLLLIENHLFNCELSKIVNYQRIRSDFQFLNLNKVLLDYILYDLFASTLFVIFMFQLIMEMSCDMLWEDNPSKFQRLLIDAFQTALTHNHYDTDYIKSSTECTNPHTFSQALPISTERSAGQKKAKQQLQSNLYGFNQSQTETSGLLGSSNQPPAQTDGASGLPITLEPSKSSLDKTDGLKAESKAVNVDITTYATDTLPGATGSHDQHYETDFGGNVFTSREETRKNVRPVFKEDDVDSILQSYHKAQITPTAITNVLQPLIQDRTKPPAKTVPSSNVDKSHRSLPRRACLVHLKEQYHLDHDLLSQPRATKYLVKVRTEISPGRYMAKLELHCSR